MQTVPRDSPDPSGAPDPSSLGWPRRCLWAVARLLSLAYFGLFLYLTIEAIFGLIGLFSSPPGPEVTLDGKAIPVLVLSEPSPPPGDPPPTSPTPAPLDRRPPLHHPSPR